MALVCKSSPLRQIHSLQQKLFYTFEWLHFKGRWKQQPHAVSDVWTLPMNYLSKQGLKGVLRQSRVLQLKGRVFKEHCDWEDSPSQTPVSVQMCLQTGFAHSLLRNLSCSYFRSILAHWIPGFYCLRRGQYLFLTIQSWILMAKLFFDIGKIFYFAWLRDQDLNICNLLNWLSF